MARKVRKTVLVKSKGPMENSGCVNSKSSSTFSGAQMISLAGSQPALARISWCTLAPSRCSWSWRPPPG